MIGIFDSGLGGLTVAKAITQALPDQKIIYLGDTARGPYGNRPPAEVAKFAVENTQFLLDKKAKIIVVGCNTASAVAGQNLLKHFPNVPIFEVITPAVREALRVSNHGKIGIIGTRTTIKSGAYQRWIKSARAVHCPLFVPLVEGGKLDSEATEEITRRYLKEFGKNKIDTLILGCTHYPFLKSMIAKVMGPRVRLIDSAQTVAKEVQNYFITPPTSPYLNGRIQLHPPLKVRGDRGVMNISKHQFYVSKITPQFQKMAEQWMGMPVKLKIKN